MTGTVAKLFFICLIFFDNSKVSVAGLLEINTLLLDMHDSMFDILTLVHTGTHQFYSYYHLSPALWYYHRQINTTLVVSNLDVLTNYSYIAVFNAFLTAVLLLIAVDVCVIIITMLTLPL